MLLFESSHWSNPTKYGPELPSPARGKKCWNNSSQSVQLPALMVYVYLGNTSVCSPLSRPAWQDPSSARLCRALSLARQPEGKQQQRLLSKRAGEKTESRLAPLSGRSSKAPSTAVRTTQGDLPDSISLTLFSVPKPNSWHVKTLLPMPAPAQVFQPRSLFCADSKMH